MNPFPGYYFFFFNDTATTEIYTLSLHDALPIYPREFFEELREAVAQAKIFAVGSRVLSRSEEHTSELQSRPHLVCRLLLEKKKESVISRLNFKCRTVRLSTIKDVIVF